jgi:hypothetical protein
MPTMKVKGSTLLGRRAMFAERIGAATYDAFVDDFARKHPSFPQPILPSTLIPVDVFLQFNDDLVRRFFGGDTKIFWTIGELSADYFSTQGPYVDSFYRGDYKRFWSILPMIWKTLYTEGEARASASGNTLDIELDCPVAHVYFELSTVAFIRRGLEKKAGCKVEMRRVSGFEHGGKIVHYQFVLPTS